MSQIQALDRTQPGLPMKKRRAGTMTHDDKRHGTTTLFAALNVLTGVVIGDCMPRHRRREFLRFLEQIDKETPADLELHLILDNYATHWSERTLAAKVGIAPSSVHKIWKAHGLKPHLVETFKLSRDPDFVAKVEDVVGLYLDPPDKALVLSVDEKRSYAGC